MPGEECRGLAQHRPSLVVLHCWRWWDIWPNVALPPSDTRWQARHHRRRPSFHWGTKTRGTKTLGQPVPRKNTRWQARHHQHRPSFPWGMKPLGTQKPWGNKALRTKPRVNKAPRTNGKGELLLGDETLGTKEELPLGDETLGTTTTTTPNLQGWGQKTTTAQTTTKQQRWRPNTKVEANESGFSSGM